LSEKRTHRQDLLCSILGRECCVDLNISVIEIIVQTELTRKASKRKESVR
jgi:hypothetical protein